MNRTSPAGRVLHVAAEMSPFASTGGLGEVVGSLPSALACHDWSSTVLLPRYRNLWGIPSPTRCVWSGSVRVERSHDVRVWEVDGTDEPRLWLLDVPELFDRDGVYGDAQGLFFDNEVRFAVLCRAAVRVACELAPGFDVLHAHDWHAAPAVVWAREHRPSLATVLTIHNYAYRGEFSARRLLELGLTCPDLPSPNFLECGILHADALTTVSPSYAREIAASGEVFARRADPPRGIVNGLDFREWNPAADPRLASRFDAETLERRVPNRDALRAELDLTGPARALAAFQGRFAWQKGLDLVLDAAPRLLDRGVQLVLHGGGDAELEQRARELAARYPGRVAARLVFDRDFSARLFAGIDLLLMPSRFEPCGLSQLQAMRYGAVPIAHATGGLKDTIHPFGERGRRDQASNGFWMKTLTPRALSLAVGKALRYLAQPEAWRTLQRNGMTEDVSWSASAARYVELYEEVRAIAADRDAAPPSPDPGPRPSEPRRKNPSSASAGEPAPGFALEGPPLAPAYGQPVVYLAAQSPRMLYAYWELPEAGSLQLWVDEDEQRREVAVVRARGEAWIPARPDRSYRVGLDDTSGAEQLRSARVASPAEGLGSAAAKSTAGNDPGLAGEPVHEERWPRFAPIGYPPEGLDP